MSSNSQAAYTDEESEVSGTLKLCNPDGSLRTLAEIEREVYTHGLSREKHRSHLARQLGVGRSTLYRKLVEFGLEVKDGSPTP